MDYIQAQQDVLEWASTAHSYDKLGFLKTFFSSLGMEEIHHVKNMLSKSLKNTVNRKRSWTGPNPTDCFNKRKWIINNSETLDFEEVEDKPVAEPSLSRPLVSRREEQPQAWWSSFKDQVCGYDVEHVHLNGVRNTERVRAGKVGIASLVNNNIVPEKELVVYHKPGTFMTNPKMVAKSGIRKYDLVNGIHMSIVKEKVESIFKDKLVIVVNGATDFTSLGLKNYDFDTFDLQEYYKRPGNIDNGFAKTGMSLRDMYFMEFNEDFQGTQTHSAVEDAKATLRIFMEGYIKRNEKKETRGDSTYSEVFYDATKLKKWTKKENSFVIVIKFSKTGLSKNAFVHLANVSLLKNEY